MKKIGVIINPNAKNIRTKKKSAEEIYNKYKNDFVNIYITKSISEIPNVIKEIKKKKFDYIGIAGGDGTLHIVLSEIINIYKKNKIPQILILKEGTMNLIGNSIKLKGIGKSILKKMIIAMEKNNKIKTFKLDTLKIEQKYGFTFGLGTVTNFLKEAYSGNEKGLKQNLKTILKVIKHGIKEPETNSMFQGTNNSIILNKKNINFDSTRMIIASTINNIGLGFTPLSRANEKDGTFHTWISNLKPLIFILNIVNIWRGVSIKNRENEHIDEIGNSLEIKGSEEFTFTLDGELYDSDGNLKLEIGPSIEFIIV